MSAPIIKAYLYPASNDPNRSTRLELGPQIDISDYVISGRIIGGRTKTNLFGTVAETGSLALTLRNDDYYFNTFLPKTFPGVSDDDWKQALTTGSYIRIFAIYPTESVPDPNFTDPNFIGPIGSNTASLFVGFIKQVRSGFDTDSADTSVIDAVDALEYLIQYSNQLLGNAQDFTGSAREGWLLWRLILEGFQWPAYSGQYDFQFVSHYIIDSTGITGQPDGTILDSWVDEGGVRVDLQRFVEAGYVGDLVNNRAADVETALKDLTALGFGFLYSARGSKIRYNDRHHRARRLAGTLPGRPGQQYWYVRDEPFIGPNPPTFSNFSEIEPADFDEQVVNIVIGDEAKVLDAVENGIDLVQDRIGFSNGGWGTTVPAGFVFNYQFPISNSNLYVLGIEQPTPSGGTVEVQYRRLPNIGPATTGSAFRYDAYNVSDLNQDYCIFIPNLEGPHQVSTIVTPRKVTTSVLPQGTAGVLTEWKRLNSQTLSFSISNLTHHSVTYYIEHLTARIQRVTGVPGVFARDEDSINQWGPRPFNFPTRLLDRQDQTVQNHLDRVIGLHAQPNYQLKLTFNLGDYSEVPTDKRASEGHEMRIVFNGNIGDIIRLYSPDRGYAKGPSNDRPVELYIEGHETSFADGEPFTVIYTVSDVEVTSPELILDNSHVGSGNIQVTT